jgi:glycogen debranching enzyme
MNQIKEQYGLLGIVDIVLNHTANNSEWVLEHPEATYNTDNCPHLFSAWLLDYELAKFSEAYALKRVPEC